MNCTLVIKLDCRWQRAEEGGQTCTLCQEKVWLPPLQLWMANEGEPLVAQEFFLCGSCADTGDEGDFKA